MSDKYRFEPYLFDPEKEPVLSTKKHFDIKARRDMFDEEREERIVKDMISGVKRYILHVDVLEWALKPKDRETVRRLTNGDVPINSVNKFEPYKKTSIPVTL